MTVASIIDPSGAAVTQYLDSDELNPRTSPPYTDGYVQHTFSNTAAGQKLRVTEAGDVDVVVGAEASATVTTSVNDYAIIVGSGSESYALGETAAGGGSVVITYAYAAPSSVPTVSTNAASSILLQSGVLNGDLSDTAGMTGLSVYFIYGLSGGSLDQSTTLESVSSTGAFDFNLSGLDPNTEYEYQAAVTDGVTVWYAATSQTFTTSELSDDPVIGTWGTNAVAGDSAVLVGLLTQMGGNSSLDVYFEWGTSTSYGNTTTTQTIAADGDNAFPDPSGKFYQQITGLLPDTQYYFRAVVTDGTNIWYPEGTYFEYKQFITGEALAGDAVGFIAELGPATSGTATVSGTTPPVDNEETYFINTTNNYYNETGLVSTELRRCRVQYYDSDGVYSNWSDWLEVYPGDLDGDGEVDEDSGLDVTTTAATSVENTTATLNGNLTDLGDYDDADVYFQLKTKQGDTYTLIEETTSENKDSTGTFSANVTDLERNTKYYVYAIAEAEGERKVGNEIIFVTAGAVVNTLNADPVGDTTATLNAELVSLEGEANLDVFFEYGFNLENMTTPEEQSTLGLFDEDLTELSLRTEYVFRAAATDGTDTWYGETLAFTTTFDVIVVTHDPSSYTDESVTLNGSINSSLDSVYWYFEYGFTTDYGLTTLETEITVTYGAEPVSAGIQSLTPGAEYHCRLVAVDDPTTPTEYWYGDDVTFTLPGGEGEWPGGWFPGDTEQSSGTTIVESHTAGLWLWDIDGGPNWTHRPAYWSTRVAQYNGHDYTATVVPGSFRGVESRVSFGSGLMSSSDLTFEIYFDTSRVVETMLDTLEGSEVLITLVKGEGVSAFIGKKWRFIIERATYRYGIIKCYCKSILQYHLTGDYPKSKNPQEIWPSSDPDSYANYCVPVIFGTAFIPIKSVNTGSDRKYVLGPSGPTYTVEKIQSPRERGTSTWDSGSYTFTQSTEDGYRMCEFLIDETVGPPYGSGFWMSGATVLLPFVKYSRSDTVSLTNPADIIAFVLRDMGVQSSRIDTGPGSTFESAKVLFANRGLVWSGGFWEKQSKESVLSSLLAMCDSFLYEGEKIELHPFTTSNHEFFDKTIEDAFSINPTLVQQSDGGTVQWPDTDAPQDDLPGKTTVSIDPFATDVTNPRAQPFQYRFQYSTTLPQKAGILYFQKQHVRNRISFTSSVLDITNLSTLIPGKVVTPYNPMIFRALKGCVVTSMLINYNLTIDLSAIELTKMNKWEDLDPDSVTITEDTTEDNMT